MSFARKFEVVLMATLALSLVPGGATHAWGQAAKDKAAQDKAAQDKAAQDKAAQDKAAKDKTGKDKGAKDNPVSAGQDVLKKAQQLKTEEGRQKAAKDAAAAAAAAAESKSKGGKADKADKAETAPKKQVQRPAAPQSEKGDPFVTPVQPSATKDELPTNLPPGQAGLLVAQAEVVGFAKTPTGARALIRGPAVGGIDRVYFLKVGDKIYNGRVTKITENAVYFEETVVDPLGKTKHREVVKSMAPEKRP